MFNNCSVFIHVYLVIGKGRPRKSGRLTGHPLLQETKTLCGLTRDLGGSFHWFLALLTGVSADPVFCLCLEAGTSEKDRPDLS